MYGRETACLILFSEFVYCFGLADDVMSTSHDIHITGKVFELVLIPRYFVDGYTHTRVSIGATYLSYLKLTVGNVSRPVPNVPNTYQVGKVLRSSPGSRLDPGISSTGIPIPG